jgi:hypothetical protein
MTQPGSHRWAAQTSPSPGWVGGALILLRSFPLQIITRSIAIVPTIAWIFICGAVPLGLASACSLRLPTSESTLTWLCVVCPIAVYAGLVIVRVKVRLSREQDQDECKSLVILDEATVLGWGVTVAVMQVFRPLNRLFIFPFRMIVSSPRGIRWALIGLLLIAGVVISWSMLPIRFVPWANQFGRGVVTTLSATGFFIMAGIVILALLAATVVFFGLWAEMLVIGGGTALGAAMLDSLNIGWLSFVAEPAIAWSRWTPAGAKGLLDESSHFHDLLTGPGGVTPFGLISMALVLHLIPLVMKKLNVAVVPGDVGMSPDDREARDNRAGWWLVVMATAALLVAPLPLCIMNRYTALADPNAGKIGVGAFIAVCVLAVLGCLILLLLIKTRQQAIDRSDGFVRGAIDRIR